MASLNLLENAKNGTLYDMDCRLLSHIRYYQESPDTVYFIYSEPAVEAVSVPKLPERFFLMPDGKEYDYRAFLFRLSADTGTYSLQDDHAGKDFYLVKGVTDDIQEVRKNFRIYISVHTSVYFDDGSREATVTIKDIGCGGFLFISENKYEPGDTFSIVLFHSSREPLLVQARIRKLRPVRQEGIYGYGCEYIGLPSHAEARILNFVFQTEVLQARSRDL